MSLQSRSPIPPHPATTLPPLRPPFRPPVAPPTGTAGHRPGPNRYGGRLSYTWHTFSPQRAAAYDISDEERARFAAERRSKVTFDIEPLGELVKLTVVHDGFEPGSAILPGISEGWPRLLADLKTLLETGDIMAPA